MGGSQSNATDQPGKNVGEKISRSKRLERENPGGTSGGKSWDRIPRKGIVNAFSVMAGKSSRAVPSSLQQSPAYPYPRPHSAYVLLPDGRISIPQRAIPAFSGTRRPPLNRAIPPIPESRSDDSLRTASSCRSAHPSAAGTPTEIHPSTSKASSNQQALVIANHSASFESPITAKRSDRVPPSPSMSQKSQMRSPLLASASRLRSKIASSFGPKKVKSQEGSSDSSQGSNQSLEKKNASLPTRVLFRHSHSNYQTKIHNLFGKDKQDTPCHTGVPQMCKAQSLELNGSPPELGECTPRNAPSAPKPSHLPKAKVGHFLSKKLQPKSGVNSAQSRPTNVVTNPVGLQSSMKKSPSLPVRKPKDAPHAVQFRPPPRPNLLRVEGGKKRVPVGCAPLAESEPSTVENSPAVELAPSNLEFNVLGGRAGWSQLPWVKRTHPQSPLAEEPPRKVQGASVSESLGARISNYSRSRTFSTEYDINNSEPIRNGGGESESSLFEENRLHAAGRNAPCGVNTGQSADVQTGCSQAMVTNTECGSACRVCEGRPHGEELYEVSAGKWNPCNDSNQLLSRLDEISEPANESVDGENLSPLNMSLLASPSPSDRSVSSTSALHSASYSSQASIRLRSPLVDFSANSPSERSGLNDATLVQSPTSRAKSSEPNDPTQFLSSNFSPSKNDPLHDSGVRVSGGESSQCSGSSGGGNTDSKIASPISDHKGLIDDEIRDQPQLTLASPSHSTNDDDWERDSIRSSDRIGPLRHSFRSSGMRRSLMRDSIISTTSLDSEDCMLDFESSIDLGISEDVGDECGDSVSVFMSGSLSRKFSESLRSARSSPARQNSLTQPSLPGTPSGKDHLKKRDSINAALEELTTVMNSFGLSDSSETQTLKEEVLPRKSSGKQGGAKGGDEKSATVQDPAHRPPSGLPPPSSLVQQRRANYGSRSATTASSSSGPTEGAGPLRPPPIPSSPSSSPIQLDPHVYRAMVQDITVLKTLLFRLKGELQKAETKSPLIPPVPDSPTPSPHPSSPHHKADSPAGSICDPVPTETLQRDNESLRQEVLLLKQQLSDRDSQIHHLKKQIEKPVTSVKSKGHHNNNPKMEVDA